MNVTLYRDLPGEQWRSMERYADQLARALDSKDVVVREYVLPLPITLPSRLGILLNQLWRSSVYSVAARHVQSDLNHVLDHSYAHLVHSLDAAKTIVTCHDLAPLALRPASARRGLSTRLWDWAFSGMLKAEHIICISHFTASELRRLTGYPSERVSIVHLGVDSSFHPLPGRVPGDEVRRGLQLPDSAHILLHVGSCAPRKNMETLLRALVHLRQRRLDFHFVQIGGVFTPPQRSLIRSEELANSLTQIPYVTECDLPLWYNLADVFVLPSTYEGFGLPVIEAMACGTPVVISNTTSLPEVVGDAGILVDPLDACALADAVFELLTHPQLHADLSHSALTRAECFSWAKCAQQTYAVYKSLLPR